MRFQVYMLFMLVALSTVSCEKNGAIIEATSFINGYYSSDGEIGAFHAVYKHGVTYATITLYNLPKNKSYAVHIHEGTCDNVGMHWNAKSDENYCGKLNINETWGKPFAGDIENVYVNDSGIGSFSLSTDFWSIGTGTETDILNAVIVVHDNPSNFLEECDPMHNPNDGHSHPNYKIACGTILPL